jgi:hypothetical protein
MRARQQQPDGRGQRSCNLKDSVIREFYSISGESNNFDSRRRMLTCTFKDNR